MAVDLSKLSYPRHLKKAGEPSKVVQNEIEAAAAIKEGYSVEPVLTKEQAEAVTAAKTAAGEKVEGFKVETSADEAAKAAAEKAEADKKAAAGKK